jgi:hypothetical protein
MVCASVLVIAADLARLHVDSGPEKNPRTEFAPDEFPYWWSTRETLEGFGDSGPEWDSVTPPHLNPTAQTHNVADTVAWLVGYRFDNVALLTYVFFWTMCRAAWTVHVVIMIPLPFNYARMHVSSCFKRCDKICKIFWD